MRFFSKQPTPAAAAPPDPVRPTEKATVADIMLAYRLILKREADPAGLAAYSQRIREGLTLEELLQCLLESPERQDRIRTGDVQPGAARVPTADASLIDPREVMRRYSVAQLNETADEYYRVMQDPDLTLRKPFQSVNETPEMLENLGALLGGLHLGKAMTVLDFGAGTCWLSRLIAQLNCAVICCDPSATALAIGRRFFEEHPPYARELLPQRFLQFDGHVLELADESVDRIICFDAFHHVPNQAEVLRELGRVLRPGGIAGFSEPGRYHSRAPQSQYDMRNHRVLENDIDLNEIFSLAEPAGFTRMNVRAMNDLAISLEQYNALFDSSIASLELRSAAWQRMHDTMLNRTVFFLHKGELRPDSRGHDGLAHRMTVHPETVSSPNGDPVTLTFTITNTGTALWLNQGPHIFGLVRLACHLYDEHGGLLNLDHFRSELPEPVAPGDTIQMTVTVPVSEQRPCILGFDLVAEGVRWFERAGSKPVQVRINS
jgi:SAM-dependent methyltransferase